MDAIHPWLVSTGANNEGLTPMVTALQLIYARAAFDAYFGLHTKNNFTVVASMSSASP
jgi:hypothetical protein